MSLCPDCAAARARDVIRGRLRVSSAPPAVYWRGEYLDRLTPRQIQMMRMLAKGTATYFGLNMLATGDKLLTSDVVKTQICHLRKKLPAGVAIRTIHNIGYELELED